MLCLVACGGGVSDPPLLVEAENCMNERPDSALLLLESITHLNDLPKEQNPLWCLLYTQAQDKNRIEHTSDSLIQIAVKYYENSNQRDRKMQAYYYCGRVFQDLNDALQAQDYYLKAYKLGKDLNECSLMGRLCANLGTLYTFQELYRPALDFQKKAAGFFSQVRDTVSLSLTFRNIARIHVCENHLDSAIANYSKALKYTSHLYKFYVLNELADTYGKNGDYERGLSYARDAYTRIETVDDSCMVSLTLGGLYLKLDKIDSAYHYLSFSQKSTNPYTLKDTYHLLSQLEKSRGNWKDCVYFQQQHEIFRDSIDKQTYTNTLARLQSIYDYRQVESEKEFYRQEADRKTNNLYQLALGSALVLLLIVIITFLLFNERREKEEQLDQSLRLKEQEYQNSNKYLEERSETIAKLEQQIIVEKQRVNDNKLQFETALAQEIDRMKEKEKALERMQAIISEKLAFSVEHLQEKIEFNNLFFSSDLYQGLSTDWKKLDETQWQEVVKMIDHVLYVGFISRIKILYPRISEQDLRVCCLTKLKIPVKRIAVLLSVNSQAISNRRKHLYETLTHEQGTAQEFDKYIDKL